MGWEREGLESREGVVGVLPVDGSEPGPVFFDLGGGGHFQESIDWWAYDGTMRRPTVVDVKPFVG
ncbi:hypothetical protein [Streptomyces sp. TLI_105]|uniref:hypothetical protein n=1 Tax=Streptomyces sp. TLI_105 TaxID=1881019 RepID=UPI00089CA8E4|nr:hypothetical protein [Streptomyces sp. TLI_105]SEB60274.1 hypothetical protein SAMN05428939_0152 [Streptomyces sp. TLI_105]